MAQIIVVVDIEDATAEMVIRAASAVEDVNTAPAEIDGWDVLAMIWGGDMEQFKTKVVVDRITDDMPRLGAPVPTVARVAGPCPCECNRGGFCGGCGHAGCGRR